MYMPHIRNRNDYNDNPHIKQDGGQPSGDSGCHSRSENVSGYGALILSLPATALLVGVSGSKT